MFYCIIYRFFQNTCANFFLSHIGCRIMLFQYVSVPEEILAHRDHLDLTVHHAHPNFTLPQAHRHLTLHHIYQHLTLHQAYHHRTLHPTVNVPQALQCILKIKDLTADLARWIKEPDVLLKTGIFPINDVTIQNIDNHSKSARMKLD